MSDFGTMKSRVAGEMKRGDLTVCASAVATAILSAIARLERKRFHFNEVVGLVVSASSSSTYVSLPATLLMVDSVRTTIGSRDYTLRAAPWGVINDVDSGQYFGYPSYYSLKGTQLRLYPPPNQDMPLTISGTQQLTEVSAAATAAATNAWMTDAEEMVRCLAKSFLFRDEVRNPQLQSWFETESMKAERELKRQSTNRQTSRLRLSTI